MKKQIKTKNVNIFKLKKKQKVLAFLTKTANLKQKKTFGKRTPGLIKIPEPGRIEY